MAFIDHTTPNIVVNKTEAELVARGIDPYNPEEVGVIYMPYESRLESTVKKKPTIPVNVFRYLSFYDEHRTLRSTKIDEHPNYKKIALREYFPKFRANGEQDISGYSNTQIGVLFKNMMEWATRLDKAYRK